MYVLIFLRVILKQTCIINYILMYICMYVCTFPYANSFPLLLIKAKENDSFNTH